MEWPPKCAASIPNLPVLFISGYHEAGDAPFATEGLAFFLHETVQPRGPGRTGAACLDLAAKAGLNADGCHAILRRPFQVRAFKSPLRPLPQRRENPKGWDRVQTPMEAGGLGLVGLPRRHFYNGSTPWIPVADPRDRGDLHLLPRAAVSRPAGLRRPDGHPGCQRRTFYLMTEENPAVPGTEQRLTLSGAEGRAVSHPAWHGGSMDPLPRTGHPVRRRRPLHGRGREFQPGARRGPAAPRWPRRNLVVGCKYRGAPNFHLLNTAENRDSAYSFRP